MPFADLREFIAHLDKHGRLRRVAAPVSRDLEIAAITDRVSKGPADRNVALLFENVEGFSVPVLINAFGAQDRMAAALGVDRLDDLSARVAKVLELKMPGSFFDKLRKLGDLFDLAKAAPKRVGSAPCQEVVETDRASLATLPILRCWPGDAGRYITLPLVFTRDPGSGARNVGMYRLQVFDDQTLGLHWQIHKGSAEHHRLAEEAQKPMDVAIALGGDPCSIYAASAPLPPGIDEMVFAGWLRGAGVPMIACRTIDLEVPAEAEIVFEGYINTQELEEEGPFGESHGYMHPRQLNPFFEITAITHRKDAIWVSFISQVTPSESSVIKKVAYEPIFTQHLRQTCNIRSVKRVVMHEPLTNLRKLIVVQMANGAREAEVWRALRAASSFNQGVGKICVAVDEDIDPEDATALWWAVCYRSRPALDVEITGHLEKGHAPPFRGTGIEQAAEGRDIVAHGDAADDSGMLINACLKEPWPPISLPSRDLMERALEIWNELGLPKVRPQRPWYGYSLGQWDDELDAEARLALRGEHFKTGEKLAQRRVKLTDTRAARPDAYLGTDPVPGTPVDPRAAEHSPGGPGYDEEAPRDVPRDDGM